MTEGFILVTMEARNEKHIFKQTNLDRYKI